MSHSGGCHMHSDAKTAFAATVQCTRRDPCRKFTVFRLGIARLQFGLSAPVRARVLLGCEGMMATLRAAVVILAQLKARMVPLRGAAGFLPAVMS